MTNTYITTEIDTKLTDFLNRQSITPLWFAQGEERPAFPYCELSILNLTDDSGIHAKDRTKILDIRFTIYTEDGSSVKKCDDLCQELTEYDERDLMAPLRFVARISDAVPINKKEQGKYIYGGYVDVRFSFTVERTYDQVAKITGEIFDRDIEINLETEE